MPRPRHRNVKRADLLAMLGEGKHDGAALVTALELNPRTLTRMIADLRAEGVQVEAVRVGPDWSYRLVESKELRP